MATSGGRQSILEEVVSADRTKNNNKMAKHSN
jgi:hypothetical protein